MQPYPNFSSKSLSILCNFRKKLQPGNLQNLIISIFKFHKTQFRIDEFALLIKHFDQFLSYGDIDDLFHELDQSGNERIIYEQFNRILTEVKDSFPMNKSLRDSVAESSHEQTIIDQINKILTHIDYPEAIFANFDTEGKGFLSRENISELLSNVGYTKEETVRNYIKHVLRSKPKIEIREFCKFISAEKSEKRIPESDFLRISLTESILIKSKFQKLKEDPQKSFQMIFDLSNPNPLVTSQIPAPLNFYFNKQSTLDRDFAWLAQDCLIKNELFLDPDQPSFTKAAEFLNFAIDVPNYQIFEMAQSVYLRPRQGLGKIIEPKDVKQGLLGDCYFLSALAVATQKYPELIHKLFVLKKNPSHIYGVRLFIDGIWRTIVVDTSFPVDANGSFCAAQPHGNEIWVMLFEKAWAKVFGSYDNINSGHNEEGLHAVTGSPSIRVHINDKDMLKKLEIELNKNGSLITCATSAYVSQLSPNDQKAMGIYSRHSYSLLSMHIFPALILFKIRNPWGNKAWKGNWSFKSTLWTSQLRKKLDYEHDPNDGSFFMCVDDFLKLFQYANICKVNPLYQNSSISIQGSRNTFAVCKFTIHQQGEYYFTIYQQNERKMRQIKDYKLSKSWLYLLRLGETGFNSQAIGSKCQVYYNSTLETTLKPGNYVIISRVAWQFWESHPYNLTSYGPEQVQFMLASEMDPNRYLTSFIESKAKLKIGQRFYYEERNMKRVIYFSREGGFGYIIIQNQDKYLLETTVTLRGQGFTVIPPDKMPLQLTVYPGVTAICCMIVDPKGYDYQVSDKYNFIKQ